MQRYNDDDSINGKHSELHATLKKPIFGIGGPLFDKILPIKLLVAKNVKS